MIDVKGTKLKTRLVPCKASHFQTDHRISGCSPSATYYRGHSKRGGHGERRLKAPGRMRDVVSKKTVLGRVKDEVRVIWHMCRRDVSTAKAMNETHRGRHTGV